MVLRSHRSFAITALIERNAPRQRESILLKQCLAVDSLVLNRRKARARERIDSFQRELTGCFAVASKPGRRGRFDWNTNGTYKDGSSADANSGIVA